MFVLPGFQRLGDSVLKRAEIPERPASFVERAANRRFREVKMAVAERIIAFAVERHVFLRGQFLAVQTVGGAEWKLQSQEMFSFLPVLGKKIGALMQTNPMKWQGLAHALLNVAREILRRDWLIR